MLSCNEATQAMSAAQERKLALGERVSLQLHLALCPHCRNFDDQVAFLRETMRGYAGRPEAGNDERDPKA
jgi:predicted anti-sigma-YlaC factor YlaD